MYFKEMEIESSQNLIKSDLPTNPFEIVEITEELIV